MDWPTLALVESVYRASNLDDACKRSLRQAELQLAVLQTNEPRQFYYIEIGEQLRAFNTKPTPDFFSQIVHSKSRPDSLSTLFHSGLGEFSTYVQAVYKEARWEITIEANLKAKVVLGNSYDVVSVEQIPGPEPVEVPGRKSPFQ